jgi:hypothetical protein
MARTDMAPKNPGSFADYEAAHSEMDKQEQLRGYSDLIHEFRLGQAAHLGVDLEELHSLQSQYPNSES